VLARGLLFVLGCEIVAYIAFGWFAVARGASFSAVLASALAVGLGWRLIAGLSTYVLAWLNRSPPPPEFERGVLALVPRIAAELAAMLATYWILLPFERAFMGDPRPPRASHSRTPVLLLHGYVCNRAAWWVLARSLRKRGETAWAVTLEPVYGSIDEWVAPIARRIDALLVATEARQVILVCHSMGGLAARAYLRRHGGGKVARLITLGSPHRGSVHARLGAGPNAREMEPESSWLKALASFESKGFAAPFTSIFSYHDNVVAPQTSAMHPAAKNLPLAGTGHLTMLFSRALVELIARELDQVNVDRG
jgi:triacylglycerol lipase